MRVRCAAACDLEAAAGRSPGHGGPAALGFGQLDGPGTARLELRPDTRGSRRALRRRKLLRVTVRATAPAGSEETVARIDVRIRRPGGTVGA